MSSKLGTVPARGGVVVSNPGRIPEVVMAAEGLARAGMLAGYIDPFAYAAPPTPVAWLPALLRRQLIDELSKRFVPRLVADHAVRRGALLESLTVLGHRVGVLDHPWFPLDLTRMRSAVFDRQVAQLLRPGQIALLACYGAALQSLRRGRALNLMTYLEFPVPHYRFAEQLLAEEAELQPEFAETLQFHRFSRETASRLDDEIRETDRVLVPSAFARDTFTEFGIPSGKVLPVPLGVDTDLFHPSEKPPKRSTFRVLFVGQITQRKGISYLLEAFRRAAIPRSELMLVGRICRSDRAWRHLPGVRHEGPLPRRELPAIYRSADVFVMPSLIEGFCLTALEAMACGLPTILSKNTLGGEITDGPSAFLVPIRDADAIAKRLVQLYENGDARDAMGHAAHERAQLFSWEHYGERIATVFGRAGQV